MIWQCRGARQCRAPTTLRVHRSDFAQAYRCRCDFFVLTTMSESLQKIEQTLQQLGVGNNEQVSALFMELRAKFNEQESGRRKENDPVNLQNFWTFWLGRKSSVL